jgi:hypothetical protein
MKTWQKYCTGLATLVGLAPAAWAQLPGAAPAVAAPVGVPAAVPAPTFVDKCLAAKAACRAALCATPLGQLLNNGLKPVSAFSGGLVQGICPTVPSAADQAKAGAEGAAAKIKADEADAKARRAAIRYLGTVDCHWWPEAEDALINALRADRNECVRYEAALALSRGCCCTKKTMAKLELTVNGSDKDGNPAENSERVKDAARMALESCLARVPVAPIESKPIEGLPRPLERTTSLDKGKVAADFNAGIERMSATQLIQSARQSVGSREGHAGTVATPHSLYEIMTMAMHTQPESAAIPVVRAEPVPVPSLDVNHVQPVATPSLLTVEPVKDTMPAAQPSLLTKSTHIAFLPAKLHRHRGDTNDAAPAQTEGAPRASAPVVSPAATAAPVSASGVPDVQGWEASPQAFNQMVNDARTSLDAGERFTYIRCIGCMNAKALPVVKALKEFENDPDPRIRADVSSMLKALSAEEPR